MPGASLVLSLLQDLHAVAFDSTDTISAWLETKFDGVIPKAPHCDQASCMGTHMACMFYVQMANILASYICKHSRDLALEQRLSVHHRGVDDDGGEDEDNLIFHLRSEIFFTVEGG